MNKVIQYVQKYNVVYFIGITILLDLLSAVFLELYFHNTANDNNFSSIFEEILLAIFFAPIIETLIFQFLIIRVTEKFTPSITIQVLVSAIIFALSHHYSVSYVMKAFFAGLLYASLFCIAREQRKNAFVVVLISHMIYNSIISLLNYIFY